MAIHDNDVDFSHLEREFELEMDNSQLTGVDSWLETDHEYMMDNEFELEYPESILDEEWEFYDERIKSYSERLFELSQMEFENEFELDNRVGQILDDIEREYFWGKLKSLGKRIVGNPMVKGLAKKAYNFAKSRVPFSDALKGVTQLVRGNLKGALGSAAKTLLNTYAPGAGAALSGLGINLESSNDDRQQVIDHFVLGAQKAYEFAADNLHPNVDNPIEASRLAGQAFEAGMEQMRKNARTKGRASHPPNTGDYRRSAGKRVVKLSEKPGEEIRKVLIIIERTQ